MKKILMLGTGGTIACVPSENGLIPALDGETLVSLVPELAGLCHIDYKQILNLDSSNISKDLDGSLIFMKPLPPLTGHLPSSSL